MRKNLLRPIAVVCRLMAAIVLGPPLYMACAVPEKYNRPHARRLPPARTRL